LQNFPSRWQTQGKRWRFCGDMPIPWQGRTPAQHQLTACGKPTKPTRRSKPSPIGTVTASAPSDAQRGRPPSRRC
jgi:hypothetical protein